MTDTLPTNTTTSSDEPKADVDTTTLPGDDTAAPAGLTDPKPEEKPAIISEESAPMAEPETFSAAPAVVPSLEPKTPDIEKELDKPTPTTPSAPPLVVTEAEVKDDASEHQKLSEEVEILTGEIQALEAKIERLTGGATPTATPPSPLASAVTPPISEPMAIAPDPALAMPSAAAPISMPEPTLPSISQPETSAESAPTTNEEPPTESVPVMTPPPVAPNSSSHLNDIYPKKDFETAHAAPAPASPAPKPTEENTSVIGMIGEIVGIIGVVLFVLMLLTPLFKEMLDATMWETLRTLGWLATVVALLVGFVLSLFQRGKWGMKIFLLLVLILAGLMHYTLSAPGSFLEPILGSLLTFYQ